MGLANLPDGSRMDYRAYIQGHPHWQKVRHARYKFDNHKCAICHTDLGPNEYETHHMSYARLGNERLRDVVTLCKPCHILFHNTWEKTKFWKGREEGHWEVFSLEHTARLCAKYYKEDRFISRDPEGPNMCSTQLQRETIDRYFREEQITTGILIDTNDIGLFVRNKRYELFFEAEARGLTVEQFLDEYFGPKVRGQNPLRQEAGRKKGPFDHEPKSFHRHYKENRNLNILMEEAKKYEQTQQL